MFTICGILVLVGMASAMPRNKEGTSCTIGDAVGVCRRLSLCPAAVNIIRQGSLPKRCGFVGKEEVVCCPKGKEEVQARSLSDQKCLYYNNVYQSLPADYILNGTMAQDAEFPHIAALGYVVRNKKELSWMCAGSLISEQFILTAAHCCTAFGKPVRALLGVNDINSIEAKDSQYDIDEKNVIIHPKFKSPYNDIALIKLRTAITPTISLSPACLYGASWNPEGLLTAAGWGATNSNGKKMSSILLKTTIQAYPIVTCEKDFNSAITDGLDNSFICAGDPEGLTDTCQGDSGGPLQIRQNNIAYIVGITSFGRAPCGQTMGFYVRVSNYLDWIEKHVWR